MRIVEIEAPPEAIASSLDELAPARQQIADRLDGRSVAIAQEWIGSRAGSEKVFEALGHLVPDADLFTLTVEPGVAIETSGRPLHVSWMDRRGLRDRRDLTLPLMPLTWRTMRRRDPDVVITSSHAFARTFAGSSASTHLSYVHSPARYLWFPDVDHRSAGWRRPIEAPVRSVLKRIDRRSTARTSSLAANSATTQGRIREVYEREARIIHPPVDVRFFDQDPTSQREPFVLAVSRFVPYKRLDLAIRVAHEVGVRLVLAGDGPERSALEELASTSGADVEFVRSPSDEELRSLYRRATALLFFANEDFGIIPVEAQACGCPVATAGEGGVLETVVGGRTGLHAARTDRESLAAAVRGVLDEPPSSDECRSNALRFSYGAFGEAVSGWIGDVVG